LASSPRATAAQASNHAEVGDDPLLPDESEGLTSPDETTIHRQRKTAAMPEPGTAAEAPTRSPQRVQPPPYSSACDVVGDGASASACAAVESRGAVGMASPTRRRSSLLQSPSFGHGTGTSHGSHGHVLQRTASGGSSNSANSWDRECDSFSDDDNDDGP
jgi:hypothetical protein